MCEMSQLVLGGITKGHELIQRLLHSPTWSKTLPPTLLYYFIMTYIFK